MYILLFLLIAVLLAIAIPIFFLSFISLSTFLHELGHAIPLLLLTRQTIGILLLPTRKIPTTVANYQLGRLKIAIPWNQIWIGQIWGICILPHPEKVSRVRLVCFILGGPLASLAIALSLLTLLFSPIQFGSSTILAIFHYFCIVLAFIPGCQLMFSVLPMKYPRVLTGGIEIPSDGLQIIHLIRTKAVIKVL
jgi:hypothetical protein